MTTAHDLLLLEAVIAERMREVDKAEQRARLGVPPSPWPDPLAALRRLVARRRPLGSAPAPLASAR